MLVVNGVFPSSVDYFRFAKAFNESELSQPQHHLLKTSVDFLSRKITASIKFADHAIFLVDHSFKEGLLSEWRDIFELKDAANP